LNSRTAAASAAFSFGAQRSRVAGLATTATRAVLRRMFHLKVEAIALRSFDEKIL